MSGTNWDAIDVAVSTIDRPHNYVHKLIPCLPKGLPLRLIVGSPSYDYLKKYSKNPSIEIIGVDSREWGRFRESPVVERALWNYWRCFVYGIKPGTRRGLLVLEDDVIPAAGWEEMLHKTLEDVESQYGQEYVLALFTCRTEFLKPVASNYYKRYPARGFFGTQAMYYPDPIRAAFTEYLQSEGVDSFRKPYDFLLAEYLRRTGVPCFATTPCLFQHIGKVSTGCSRHFIEDRHFAKPVTPIDLSKSMHDWKTNKTAVEATFKN